jgi:hypothetical protein
MEGKLTKSQSIFNQSYCVDTPQQNRIAERKNNHLFEVVSQMTRQKKGYTASIESRLLRGEPHKSRQNIFNLMSQIGDQVL